VGGILVGSGDGSVAGTVGPGLLKDRSSKAPGGGMAAVTSTLQRVAVCGGSNSFGGVRALCAGAFAASMAAVRRALGRRDRPPWRW
jgi:hypothetical protein